MSSRPVVPTAECHTPEQKWDSQQLRPSHDASRQRRGTAAGVRSTEASVVAQVSARPGQCRTDDRHSAAGLNMGYCSCHACRRQGPRLPSGGSGSSRGPMALTQRDSAPLRAARLSPAHQRLQRRGSDGNPRGCPLSAAEPTRCLLHRRSPRRRRGRGGESRPPVPRRSRRLENRRWVDRLPRSPAAGRAAACLRRRRRLRPSPSPAGALSAGQSPLDLRLVL